MVQLHTTKKLPVQHYRTQSDSLNPERISQWKPARHVKAFVRSQKNDANDALAIYETTCRPGIHFVPVKTTEPQDIKALRNTRQLMVE